MKRAFPSTALAALLLLGGCGGGEPEAEKPDETIPAPVAKAPRGAPAVESEYGTPVKDRKATIALLNKRNNLTEDIVLKTGESRRLGNVVIRLATCERTLPWESPPEVGAFVQVYVEERAGANQRPAWRTAFSGWLFKNSPSLNAVEHPVYDVWVKDCTMKFPNEEEPVASASSAAKASGKASAPRPSPTASPSTAPSAASPAPTPSASASSAR